MKIVHVCVPVLRRYDMLRNLLRSLTESTVPYEVHVIDNGRNHDALVSACDGYEVDAITPSRPLGVAESWNWFIKNIPEERVITNDDILFEKDSLELMAASKNDIAWSKEAGFSCFLIRDSCIAKIGLFDEKISPGYGYYEDMDYAMRIDGRGKLQPKAVRGDVVCHVNHIGSQTVETFTRAELNEHHRRFRIAQQNFMKKWNLEGEAFEAVHK